MEAIRLGEVGNVRRLLERGADPMAPDSAGKVLPLQLASTLGNPEIVAALLVHGADPDSSLAGASTVFGLPPLALALYAMHDEAAAELIKAKADFVHLRMDTLGAFEYAVMLGLEKSVMEMIKLGANPDVPFGWPGETLLHEAARQGDTTLLETLLKAGADLEIKNEYGATALVVASMAGQTQAIRLLLDAGADANARDLEGNFPLQAACIRGDTALVRQLLAHGADITLQNLEGEMALHFAAYHAHGALARMLLDAGAPVNARTRFGATPTRIAWELNNDTLADLIAAYGGRLR